MSRCRAKTNTKTKPELKEIKHTQLCGQVVAMVLLVTHKPQLINLIGSTETLCINRLQMQLITEQPITRIGSVQCPKRASERACIFLGTIHNA